MLPHLHKFKFDTLAAQGHIHRVYGRTENMVGISNLHFHYYCGISAYCNHTHYFSGFTGLPIKTENGHIHRIEGIVEINNLHEHTYSNYTWEEIEYIKRAFMKKIYI